MGLWKSKMESNVICIGLDNSGKSTLINYIKPLNERAPDIVPTVGFAVQKVAVDQVNFTIFDMSGSGKYRNLWEHYYSDVKGTRAGSHVPPVGLTR